MVERLSTVTSDEAFRGSEKKKEMIKTYSFTTDDDDAIPIAESQHIFTHKSNNLLTVNSPTVNHINHDDSLSESGSKIKKRKSRRETDDENSTESRRPSKDKHRPYTKIVWTKILIFVAILFLLYFTWSKREKLIPRLLASRSRIRRPITPNEELISNKITDSSVISSSQEDKIENINQENNNLNDNERSISDSLISKSKSHLKTRRNKISFNQDRRTKKHRELNDQSIEEENSLAKKPNRNETSLRSLMHLNTSLILYNYNDIVNQIRKHLKTKVRDRQFFSILSKTTGLSKQKLHRFIYHKDYKLLTLRTFISL